MCVCVRITVARLIRIGVGWLAGARDQNTIGPNVGDTESGDTFSTEWTAAVRLVLTGTANACFAKPERKY